VISSARIDGFPLTDAVSSRHTTRFISDILMARGGELRIVERSALCEEIGRRMADVTGRLIVAVERDGEILGFWNSAEELIRDGNLVFALEGRIPEPA
jgi:voltage-gated potassium channel